MIKKDILKQIETVEETFAEEVDYLEAEIKDLKRARNLLLIGMAIIVGVMIYNGIYQ